MKTIEMVKQFHTANEIPTPSAPVIPSLQRCALRVSLIREELDELAVALMGEDTVGALDALCDLQYVLDGTFLELGMQGIKEAAFAEVHRSNMTKLGADGKPLRRPDGKVIKGPNYEPPNLKQFIQ